MLQKSKTKYSTLRANDLSKQHPSDPPPTYSHPLHLTPVHCVRLAHTGHRAQYTASPPSFEEIVFTVYIRASLTFPRHPSCHICPPLWGCAAPWPPPWASPWSWPCQTVSRAAWWLGWRGWRLCHCCWAHRSLLSPVSQCHHLQLCAGAGGRSRLRAALGPRVALLGSARKLGGGCGAGRRLALDLEFQPFTKAHTSDK